MGDRKSNWKREVVILPLVALAVFLASITKRLIFPVQGNPKDLVDEVWSLIDQHYVDDTFNQVDWAAVRTDYLGRSYSNREEAYNAIREMLGQLEDPYTRFMDPQTFHNMQNDTSGELTGVGIQIAQDEEFNHILVVAPIENTPAFDVGIRAKDVIVAIDGASTQGMDLNAAVTLIRGRVGSSVTLTIQRNEQLIDFEIERARIEIHPVRYTYQSGADGGIGYIRLTQFSANAAAEMRQAIEDLEQQGVVGYILDLRSNPGGLLYSSIDIARMWLEDGNIVSTVNRQGIVDEETANNRALTHLPLVVLVDGGSASASEILSGALQDNERAVLVGTQTFGKGLVQSVRRLSDGSGLTITQSKYLTPNGRDIHLLGIEPDVLVELTEADREALSKDQGKIGTLEDPQYSRALDELSAQASG